MYLLQATSFHMIKAFEQTLIQLAANKKVTWTCPKLLFTPLLTLQRVILSHAIKESFLVLFTTDHNKHFHKRKSK